MPADFNLLSFFPNINQVSIEEVASRLKKPGFREVFENQLGNLILYPQTIPQTFEQIEFELAVLKEVLRLNPDKFFNPPKKVIVIPEIFLERYTDLKALSLTFIDAFKPFGITSLVLLSTTAGTKNLGTLISPEEFSEKSKITLFIEGKEYIVPLGTLTMIPDLENKIDIRFESKNTRLLGKENLLAEIFGGPLGVIIDTRKR